MCRSPDTSRSFLSTVVLGAALGALLAPGVMILCVVTCVQITDEGNDDSGPVWLLPAAIRIAAFVGSTVGPVVGGVIGAIYVRRRTEGTAAK